MQEHDEPLVSWQTYTLKRGDRLDHLANKHGISLDRLKQVNNIGRHTRVGPGYQLLLPLKGALLEPLPVAYQPPSAPEARTSVRKLSYTVRHGDTLTRIAQRYKVSTDDLRRWNEIGRLATGQHLVIEVRGSSTAKSTKSGSKKRAAKKRR